MFGDYYSERQIHYRTFSIMLSSSAHPCVPFALIWIDAATRVQRVKHWIKLWDQICNECSVIIQLRQTFLFGKRLRPLEPPADTSLAENYGWNHNENVSMQHIYHRIRPMDSTVWNDARLQQWPALLFFFDGTARYLSNADLHFQCRPQPSPSFPARTSPFILPSVLCSFLCIKYGESKEYANASPTYDRSLGRFYHQGSG